MLFHLTCNKLSHRVPFIGREHARESLQVDNVEEQQINNGFSDAKSLGVGSQLQLKLQRALGLIENDPLGSM